MPATALAEGLRPQACCLQQKAKAQGSRLGLVASRALVTAQEASQPPGMASAPRLQRMLCCSPQQGREKARWAIP